MATLKQIENQIDMAGSVGLGRRSEKKVTSGKYWANLHAFEVAFGSGPFAYRVEFYKGDEYITESVAKGFSTLAAAERGAEIRFKELVKESR